jgi:hypothetical protein
MDRDDATDFTPPAKGDNPGNCTFCSETIVGKQWIDVEGCPVCVSCYRLYSDGEGRDKTDMPDAPLYAFDEYTWGELWTKTHDQILSECADCLIRFFDDDVVFYEEAIDFAVCEKCYENNYLGEEVDDAPEDYLAIPPDESRCTATVTTGGHTTRCQKNRDHGGACIDVRGIAFNEDLSEVEEKAGEKATESIPAPF